MSSSVTTVDLFDDQEQISIPMTDDHIDVETKQFDEIIGVLEEVLVGPYIYSL